MMELALRPRHEVSGALFRAEGGWEVPTGYGPLDGEVLGVRRSAGVIDFSDRAKIEVTGEDRVTFLDGLVTADIKTLAPGRSAYALVLNEKSRVLGDLRIHALPDAFVLDLDAAQKDALLAHLQKFLVSDDVSLRDLGPCGHLEVHGPLAPAMVSSVVDTDVMGLPLEATAAFPIGRHEVGRATRVHALGEAGFALWTFGSEISSLWDGLVRGGATPFGRDAYEVLRIEAGTPRFGVDMTKDTLALEVAPPGAISMTKGCYQGQEVVARGTYVGHMNRRLLGLLVDGDTPPLRGDVVTADAQDVGSVTSACWSPSLGWVLALALLRTDRLGAAPSFGVNRDGWEMSARLVGLPFVLGSA